MHAGATLPAGAEDDRNVQRARLHSCSCSQFSVVTDESEAYRDAISQPMPGGRIRPRTSQPPVAGLTRSCRSLHRRLEAPARQSARRMFPSGASTTTVRLDPGRTGRRNSAPQAERRAILVCLSRARNHHAEKTLRIDDLALSVTGRSPMSDCSRSAEASPSTPLRRLADDRDAGSTSIIVCAPR